MPIDPQDGIDGWIPIGNASGGADHPDEWIPLGDAGRDPHPDEWISLGSGGGDTSPDDWIPLASPSSNTAPRTFGAQLNSAGAGSTDPSAATVTNRPEPSPDPLAAYWSRIPASRLAAVAWHPPIFPDAFGRYPLPALPTANVPLPSTGLLAGLANLQPAIDDSPMSRLGLLGGLASRPVDKPWSIPGNLDDLPGSPPPSVSGGAGSAGDGYVDGGNGAGQPDNALYGGAPVDAPRGLAPPSPSPPALPLLQQTAPASGDSDQSAPQSLLGNSARSDQPAPSTGSGDVEDNSRSGTSAASQTSSDDSGLVTRVVRDRTGRALAIVAVQRAPSDAPASESVNDATPDPLRPGARLAQLNNAVTNNPVIDRTTNMLLDVMQEAVQAIGSGSGPLFGTRVHSYFGKRVKQLDLPGIGQDGVEQSFHFDLKNFARYGMEGSIRTDVVLIDPKNPNGGAIAVYDLKTGNAVLTPARVEEIRKALKQPDVPVIMLHYRTGDAIMPPGSAPRR
jgi:hypothetical protein